MYLVAMSRAIESLCILRDWAATTTRSIITAKARGTTGELDRPPAVTMSVIVMTDTIMLNLTTPVWRMCSMVIPAIHLDLVGFISKCSS